LSNKQTLADALSVRALTPKYERGEAILLTELFTRKTELTVEQTKQNKKEQV
jgi:hypothetical protein